VSKSDKKQLLQVRYLKGVGPSRAEILAKNGIETIEDLLHCLPRKYDDRSNISRISDVRINEQATICASIESVESAGGRYGRMHRLMLQLDDGTGEIDAVFFNQKYLEGKFEEGMRVLVTGKVKLYGGRGKKNSLQIASPEFEIIEKDESADGGIVPFYTVPAGLGQQFYRRLMRGALERMPGEIEDGIPEYIRKKRALPNISTALRGLHAPEKMSETSAALRRLKYEEFFVLETTLALRRLRNFKTTGAPISITEKIDSRIRALYDFKLTGAQEKVIKEISKDLKSPHPMNRLLQGDVGSGKTAAAVYAILAAVANGYQAAFMAPTEILAEQHFGTLSRYLSHARLKTAFLTSSAGPERKDILNGIKRGLVDIVVGTHALVQKDVEFSNLGLVVVDEQHKFGVMQRAGLRGKGEVPHILVMTATPIPRTLSLTVYGDLDISILDEMPPGRKPVETHFVPRKNENRVFDFVKKTVKAGRQAYFVYPLIDSTEETELRSATEMFEKLDKDIFPKLDIGLLHGRMKSEEKEKIMKSFKSGKIDILVSTVVIEVGVDVPNASIMVIDHCERFGLAQLHQLRGRIGRGGHHSTCLLLGQPSTDEAKRRVKAILATSDGFKIAEEDLRIRGPGQFFGTKQSGLPDLKVADIIEDYKILRIAREDAFEMIENDPELSSPSNRGAKNLLIRRLGGKAGLISVG